MSRNNITLKDLAKKLNVSVSTISKALNDSHEISDATKKRIQKVAKKNNYQPNKIALNLKFGKTNIISVIIPSIQNYFFSQVLIGIESIIAKSPYNIIVSISSESSKIETQIVKTLSNGVVDGFIIAVAEETQTTQKFGHFKSALANNKPLVMFDRVVKSIDCDKVVVDDFESVFDATKHLIDIGKKSIALVATIHNLSVGKSRTNGYIKALKEMSFVPLIIENTKNKIYESVENLLLTKKIDAIIAIDEESSLASLKIVKKLNFKIPKQLAIIGYASKTMAANLSPELTTIHQHGFLIGQSCAEMLLKRLKNNHEPMDKKIINSTLNIRETCL